MRRRRIAVLALSGALVAGGAGAAIAGVTRDDGKKTEQAVLDDAAKRLDVTPQKLRDALSAALDAQVDQAVKDGDLTQKQADAIKQARKDSGHVLGGPGLRGGPPILKLHRGPGFGPSFDKRGPHGFGIRLDLFETLAKALGTSQQQLMAQLRDGKSVADVAKANGKSLADVRSAVKAAVKSDLDKAVKDGDLTQKQADEMLDHISEKITAVGSGRAKGFRMRGEHHRFDTAPPPGAPRPGSLEFGTQEGPDIVMPADGVFD
jgi:polyhydroxyalkanoate synthesis regulator phasin